MPLKAIPSIGMNDNICAGIVGVGMLSNMGCDLEREARCDKLTMASEPCASREVGKRMSRTETLVILAVSLVLMSTLEVLDEDVRETGGVEGLAEKKVCFPDKSSFTTNSTNHHIKSHSQGAALDYIFSKSMILFLVLPERICLSVLNLSRPSWTFST